MTEKIKYWKKTERSQYLEQIGEGTFDPSKLPAKYVSDHDETYEVAHLFRFNEEGENVTFAVVQTSV
jgi:hypothetical protein